MNKKQTFIIFALIVAILAVVTATILLWPASFGQPEPIVEDAATPSTEEPTQEVAPASDELLEGTEDAESVESVIPLPAPGELSYEDYNAMPATSQRAYMESFENVEDFFVWYYDAKDAYDEAHPDIEVVDGVIDLEELLPDE